MNGHSGFLDCFIRHLIYLTRNLIELKDLWELLANLSVQGRFCSMDVYYYFLDFFPKPVPRSELVMCFKELRCPVFCSCTLMADRGWRQDRCSLILVPSVLAVSPVYFCSHSGHCMSNITTLKLETIH